MQSYSIMLQQIIRTFIGCLVLNRMVMDHQILALNSTCLVLGTEEFDSSHLVPPKHRPLYNIEIHGMVPRWTIWNASFFWFCCEAMLMCIFYRKCNLAGSKTMFCSCFVWTCNWGWFYTSPSFRQDIWIIYCKFPSFPSMLTTLDLLSVKLVICGCSKFCRVTKTL